MNEFVIAEKDSGQRLDRYIARLLPLAPKSFLYKALRNKDIRLNGKKASGGETVQAGDRVLFRFPDLQFADLVLQRPNVLIVRIFCFHRARITEQLIERDAERNADRHHVVYAGGF